ncbi:MAG: FAD-dependent thymidylate synthase [Acutalibacteraceae bacterium]
MSAKVTLISHTPMPEKTIAAAAKLCYSPASIDNIMDGLTEEKTASFVDMLATIGHESPIEHASFTFGIEGISRACSHQLVRHRIASYSQQSQRYVDGNKFDFVTPPEIAEDENALEEYNKAISMQCEAYAKVRGALIAKYIKKYLGISSAKNEQELIESFKAEHKKEYSAFEKKANEDARFILPNACTTSIVVTMNARSLMNFFSHRCCNRAQWEIRDIAIQMYRLCMEKAPNVFKLAGPPCTRGGCTEGKMSCGKQKEVRSYFEDIRKSVK